MKGLKFRGRPPILIAESVKDVVSLKNEYARILMDRRQPIDESFINAIVAQSVMSWEGRNPSPALDPNGNVRGTDLDLLSFLMAARGAVIEIPRYRNRRQVVVRANERKIGTNQFGPIKGLTSSQKAFSFSVLILDQTIVKKDLRTGKEKVGAPRNYMLVDPDGHWYVGWDMIRLDPSREENRFFTDWDLYTGNTVFFRYYVHPNRWQSVFGAPHLLKKMAIARINDEVSFYRKEVKRLQGMGIRFPPGKKKEHISDPRGPTVPIRVNTMEMVLDIPEFSGTYPEASNTQKGLVWASQHQKFLTYVLRPFVQFGVRANEAAYFKYGINYSTSGAKVAHWMEGRTWNLGWKAPGGRVEWSQMVLSPDVALRYRVKTVTQRVSAE